jgi:glutaminyl-peptide cyclotransferase
VIRPALCAALFLALAGPAGAAAPSFDAERAYKLVQLQLSYGERPAGSEALQRLAPRLRARLPHGRFEALPGQRGLQNIVGTLPGRRPGIVIGAHYDTIAAPGFVGANNAAAGTAVVLEVARVMAKLPRRPGAREIRFVLFDGEEPPSGLPEDSPDFYNSGLRGSRAYVEEHPQRTQAMVLLDWVGNKGLSIPREENSSPTLWAALRRAAGPVGAAGLFPDSVGPGYFDDHTPFQKAGVRAIDLIDPHYEGHSTADTIDKLSRRSLELVGKTIVTLARDLR